MYTKLIKDRRARSVAATTVAVLLAAVGIGGCASAAASSGGGYTTTTTAAPATSTADPAGTCRAWPGVGDLNAVAFPLRELADDKEIYGPFSDMDNSAEDAVSIAELGLSQIAGQLPDPYFQEIQDEVLSVGSDASAAQLETAADDAQALAATIGRLCYTP
jgi:hypothetical protein